MGSEGWGVRGEGGREGRDVLTQSLQVSNAIDDGRPHNDVVQALHGREGGLGLQLEASHRCPRTQLAALVADTLGPGEKRWQP